MGSISRKIIALAVIALTLTACPFDGRMDNYEERLNSWSVIYYSIHNKSQMSNVQIYLNIENNPCFKSLIEDIKINGYPNTDNRLVQSTEKFYYNEEEILVLYRADYDKYDAFWFITKPKNPIHEISDANIDPILSEITMAEFDSIYNLKKDTYKMLDRSMLKDSFKRVLGWEIR